MAIRVSAQADLLAMALVGYEREKAKIEASIAEIRGQLGLRGPGRPKAATGTTEQAAPAKRTLSAAARRRIAEAQRKRWAALKGAKAGPEKPKRRLSAAGRRAIIEATKKRWAAFHKAANAKKAAAKALKKTAPQAAAAS